MKRTILLIAAGLLLVPALASADIYNRTPLGNSKQDRKIRSLIARRLNKMPGDVVGRGPTARFSSSKKYMTGTKSMHPGPFGTQISVDFQAQPLMKVKIHGKPQRIPLGGCAGDCGILQPVQGRSKITGEINITARLRSMAPPMAPPLQALGR
jgi:hypothetical protein